MTTTQDKADLQRYLQTARDALLWKLDGLSEYDIRRPMTPTGTNLLGLVKHMIGVEYGYFGPVFGRAVHDLPSWLRSDEPNADMWATSEESREDIVDAYRRAWVFADLTISELDLDSPGLVKPWPEERRDVTLHQILVHVVAEIHRHAGHADVVREMIDGSAGLRPDYSNLGSSDQAWWADYCDHLEKVARSADHA
ncbi:DinB family protein [Rhodococcus sp. ARC_M6]|uniref:DinB family protein n=1 Tax=Rhodococcus sp. ARC_M6 TaxID=2928852 RepID=UPI001FB316FC|nr:DinB family protein [Rhodococcus sp. ARC_M6]MCJ0906826.1 DinB family protein [Rhodococcus sp. ARC_M6]